MKKKKRFKKDKKDETGHIANPQFQRNVRVYSSWNTIDIYAEYNVTYWIIRAIFLGSSIYKVRRAPKAYMWLSMYLNIKDSTFFYWIYAHALFNH